MTAPSFDSETRGASTELIERFKAERFGCIRGRFARSMRQQCIGPFATLFAMGRFPAVRWFA